MPQVQLYTTSKNFYCSSQKCMVQFLSQYCSTSISSSDISRRGRRRQIFPAVRGKMRRRSKKDMTVGEGSPIPLKPTLARTMSAKRRRQRPTKTPHADQVLGALWKMAEPRQSVWNRVEAEDDSEIEEVEELESCLT
ncbi:uncharacterized protein LOC111083827, partial [Limulus polyphemus]|uniref:Uncharacterized protein LOC111083827 n=1 Tax=Limulus polyphemus TaxID=6850 RepID=A0ABM1RXX7_LIMPO